MKQNNSHNDYTLNNRKGFYNNKKNKTKYAKGF